MLHFVILWDARVFLRLFNFVKNAQFCHFVRGPWNVSILQFCQKRSILSFSERPVDFFHFFKFVKNCPFCHLWKVDFKLWDKNKYTICTLCVVIYQTILSKRLNFVILLEDRGFLRFFNFVKNAKFCHFVRAPWIFSILQFCQKCSILSFCEMPVYFYAYSILSKMLNFVILWEDRGMFRFFNFVIFRGACGFFSLFQVCQNCPFCHLWKVDFKIQFCQKLSILSFVKSGLQIMR